MEKKIRKITIEWESAEVPEWFENLACDNRCLSFSMKEAVTKQEWHELIQNKAGRLMCEQSWLKEFPDKALEFAEKLIECIYYIE